MANKALTQSDIAHKAERWAKHHRDLEKLTAKAETELEPLRERHARELQAALAKHQPAMRRLEAKIDTLYSEVVGWLKRRKKSITVTSRNAVAQLLTGTRPGNRVPDPQKFIATCKDQKKDPWSAINVVIARAEPILGKNEFDKICTKQDIEFNDVSLKLKG